MDTTTADSTIVETANEMYWGSDRSVNQIADDLDLSKGALYEILEPHSAGVACATCGAEVGYANRTAKDKGVTVCSGCGWEGDLIDTVRLDPEPRGPVRKAREVPAPVAPPLPAEEDDIVDPTPPPPLPDVPVRVIAGGALLGAAVGLAIVLWNRRR